MPKFERLLNEERRVSWRDHYVDYAALKATLKDVAFSSSPSLSSSGTSPFEIALRRQIEKADAFYVKRLTQLRGDFRTLWTSDAGVRRESDSLEDPLLLVRADDDDDVDKRTNVSSRAPHGLSKADVQKALAVLYREANRTFSLSLSLACGRSSPSSHRSRRLVGLERDAVAQIYATSAFSTTPRASRF